MKIFKSNGTHQERLSTTNTVKITASQELESYTRAGGPGVGLGWLNKVDHESWMFGNDPESRQDRSKLALFSFLSFEERNSSGKVSLSTNVDDKNWADYMWIDVDQAIEEPDGKMNFDPEY